MKFFLTKSGEKKLGELMKDEHPLQDIKDGKATDVEIIGITKQTGKNLTYQVRWKEKVFDKVDLESEYTMTAFVMVKLSRPTTEDAIQHNPFGIYLDDISWSKER